MTYPSTIYTHQGKHYEKAERPKGSLRWTLTFVHNGDKSRHAVDWVREAKKLSTTYPAIYRKAIGMGKKSI